MVYYTIVMLDLGFPGGAYHVLKATQQVNIINELFLVPMCFENLFLTLVYLPPRIALSIPSSIQLGRKLKILQRDAKLEHT